MLKLTSFEKNPNIGVFARANESFAFLPLNAPEKFKSDVENCLEVEIIEMSINQSSLIGTLIFANDNAILLPKNALKSEIEELKKKIKNKINIEVVDSKFTALGNLILANNKGAVISNVFSEKEAKKIAEKLDVDFIRSNIAGFKVVGSIGIATDKGALVCGRVSEEEVEKIEDIIKVNVEFGSVNQGSGYVRAGIIANKKGALIGNLSTSPEITRIQDALEV